MTAAKQSVDNGVDITALLVAAARAHTLIYHARDIAKACKAESAIARTFGSDRVDVSWLRPLIELRYWAIETLLSRFWNDRPQSVLDIGAGFSPRGLINSRDKKWVYVEGDLNPVVREKQRIVRDILGQKERENFHVVTLNILNKQQYLVPGTYFQANKQVSVVCEGVLPRLSPEEKEQAAQNIRTFMVRYPGSVWITPDFSSHERFDGIAKRYQIAAGMIRDISARTGCAMFGNLFETETAAEQCCGRVGFALTRHKQASLVGELISLSTVSKEFRPIVDQLLSDAEVWELRPIR